VETRLTLLAAILGGLLLAANTHASAESLAAPRLERINTTHCCVARDKRGRIQRSQAVRHAFARLEACPSTGQNRLPCPGWRIDHIVPLKRCGPDTLPNLQWLTIEDWKAKSLWE